MSQFDRPGVRAFGLVLITILAAWTLAGCASWPPGSLPLGTPISTVHRGFLGPTEEFALPDGGTRLEFGVGGFRRETFMLDFDPNGLLVSNKQVLTEENFWYIKPGMPESEVLMRLGRPAQVVTVDFQKLHVWNYRFARGDCVVFQVSISDAQRAVTESGLGSDLGCGGRSTKGGKG
jgi:hypothetical protein